MLNRRRNLGLAVLVLLLLPLPWADAHDAAPPAPSSSLGHAANVAMQVFRGGPSPASSFE